MCVCVFFGAGTRRFLIYRCADGRRLRPEGCIRVVIILLNCGIGPSCSCCRLNELVLLL